MTTGEPSLVGRIVDDRYRIVAPLGEGGMGVVFRAEHIRLQRPVALKVLQQEYVENDQLKLRFERECRALSALSHPNIVTITDYGVLDQTPYLVMELLEGETLHQRLRQGGLPPERAIAIARQMLRALAHAHRQGMVHRDLKPGNIFLRPLPDDTDHVTILDFGLVRFVAGSGASNEQELTRAGAMLGTPAYMAPEQAAGEMTDARTDVYAAGVVLFEMLTGKRPFDGDPGEILRHHMLSPVPKIAEVCGDLLETEAIDALLGRALAKERQLRFADAADLLEALEGVHLPVVAPNAPPRAPKASELGTMATVHAGDLVRGIAEAPRPVEPTQATVAAPRGPGRTPAPTPSSTIHLRDRGSATGDRAKATRLWIGGGLACVGLLSLVAMATGSPDDPPPPAAARVTSGTASPDGTPSESTPAAGTRTVAPPSSAAESPEPEPPARGEPPAAPAAGTGNVVTAPRPAAVDPWAAGVPRNLARMKRAVDSGREISERADRGLIAVARDNPADARPHLLLAGAFLSRGWRSDAVERYELAYDRDPSSRGDPRMLHDLVMLGADSAAGGKASRAVQRIYGREALAEIDRQLGAGGLGRDGRARLLRLRAAIENGS